MTPNQILEKIKTTPELLALVPNTQAIADKLSEGLTKTVPTEVGNGTILEVLGLATGNALLDVITGNADFRHVKPLIEQGRLRLDSPLTTMALTSLVGIVITEAQKDALLARCRVPDSVDEFQVRVAIFNDDGTLKV